MADGRSRKRSKSKRGEVKKPQMRAAKGAAKRAEIARQKAKRQAAQRAANRRPTRLGVPIRVRPEGGLGAIFAQVCAWLIVAAIASITFSLDRWFSISYPDSLWFIVAIGAVVAAPAIGYIARSMGDVWLWAFTTLIVTTTLLVLEYIIGPKCPSASCGTAGARGAYHVWGSLLIVFGSFVLVPILGALSLRFSRKRRPSSGYIAHRVTAGSMVMVFMFVGLPIAAAAVGTDMWARKEPARAQLAITAVEQECFDFDEKVPALAVRPSPSGRSSLWSDYAVGRKSESRAKVGKNTKLSSGARRNEATPYEAVVSVTPNEDIAFLSCRWISARAGTAPQSSIEDESFGAGTPIRPNSTFAAELKQPTTPAKTPKKAAAKKK